MNELPELEMDTQGKVWKGPECRTFCPCGVGVYTFPTHRCIQSPGSSPGFVLEGFLWRFHRVGMIVH